ncbi:EF-hand domain-containing protein [Salinisphaera hydrothermalis]|uniref:Putative signal transduction protein with EFhand domain n=1 Tax=Salinisphaera hydrothermalis (strain C41B8) TaxID=1304275 RepID=A0A084IQF1_SALHC|nr:EF-hand domain-containing protein [Salinisphaera hydrothermalis]KEZ78935.1 putative signal transduction protein with EFhand domain [Salinisphaera hydrothermalis C41B8]
MFKRFITAGRRAVMVGGTSLMLVATAQATGLTSADTNQDGKISRAEANAAQDRAFTKLDTNGDGTVDEKEFDAGQPGLPADATEQDKQRRHQVIASWFKHMDANGDGKISRSEYRKALQPYFDRLDTNGDGYISKDELRAAFGNRGNDGGAKQ